MSTEVKNTLFRFVTMRAPELLKDNTSEYQFIRHPEADRGPGYNFVSAFMKTLNQVQDAQSRKRSLEAASLSVQSPMTGRFAVKEFCGAEFFEFADWLTRNRTGFTKDELETKIAGIDKLMEEQRLKLWDNLFLQIFSGGSNYARDGILSALVADNLVRKYDRHNDNVDRAPKLAQARIVIPKGLFGSVATSKKMTQNKPVNLKKHKQAIQVALLKDEISQLESVLSDVEKLEKFIATYNGKNLEDRKNTYNGNVKDAYSRATLVTQKYVDEKGISRTYHEYENLEIPEFSFVPEPDFSALDIVTNYSDTTYNFLLGLENNHYIKTFAESKEFIRKEIQTQTARLMSLSGLTEKMVALGKTVVPQSALQRPPMTYSMIKTGTVDKPVLTLTMIGLLDTIDVVSANYSVKFNDNHVVLGPLSHQDTRVGSDLIVDLFNVPGHYFNVSAGQYSFTLSGRLTCSDGTVINLNDGLGEITPTIAVSGTNTTSSSGNSATAAIQSYADEISGKGSQLLKDGSFAITGSGKYLLEFRSDNEIDTSDPDAPESAPTTPNPTNGSVLPYIPSGFGVTKLGIADYRRVEQEVCCYVPGEVSHIENIMAREYKEKSSRSLRRSEITETTSSERESEKLTDTTSTDRFEMNQEATSVISEQNSVNAHTFFDGHTAVGKNTTFNFGVSGDFAHSVSKEISNSQAISQAKEVTERALDRVVTKVKEERTTKMIEEYEENNKHGFDNRKGDKHISGVFRWVDKIYRNRILNYGKRLMYEFMIPEPAALHKTMTSYGVSKDVVPVLAKPIDPRSDKTVPLTDYTCVNDNNYPHWAAAYNAEVEPMPKSSISVGASFNVMWISGAGGKLGTTEAISGSGKVVIPDDYYAVDAHGNYSASGENSSNNGNLMSLTVGNKTLVNDSNPFSAKSISASTTPYAPNETDPFLPFTKEVPVSYTLGNNVAGDITVTIECALTEQAKKKWQIQTFNAIITAYEEKLADYEKKLAETQQTVTQQINLNPSYYRDIENTVLRKNCLDYLASASALGEKDLITDRGETTVRARYDSPELETYAAKVKFFEQAFEWELMSYFFYPFYWAKNSEWRSMYLIENDDPLFRSFLQSGMARIILTVRPGFEEAVNWYMTTGQIWNGTQIPTIDDPMYISIVDEMQNPEGTVEGEWESRVPTSLTVIQAGTIGLDVKGLPCDDDCADFKLFDSDGNVELDENGQPKSTNPLQQQPAGTNLGNVVDDVESLAESISDIKNDIEEIKTALNVR